MTYRGSKHGLLPSLRCGFIFLYAKHDKGVCALCTGKNLRSSVADLLFGAPVCHESTCLLVNEGGGLSNTTVKTPNKERRLDKNILSQCIHFSSTQADSVGLPPKHGRLPSPHCSFIRLHSKYDKGVCTFCAAEKFVRLGRLPIVLEEDPRNLLAYWK